MGETRDAAPCQGNEQDVRMALCVDDLMSKVAAHAQVLDEFRRHLSGCSQVVSDRAADSSTRSGRMWPPLSPRLVAVASGSRQSTPRNRSRVPVHVASKPPPKSPVR